MNGQLAQSMRSVHSCMPYRGTFDEEITEVAADLGELFGLSRAQLNLGEEGVGRLEEVQDPSQELLALGVLQLAEERGVPGPLQDGHDQTPIPIPGLLAGQNLEEDKVVAFFP